MNKKALYTSIMKDVSKIVKRHLNEGFDGEYYDDDEDFATIYNAIIAGAKNDEIPIIGIVQDTPCLDYNDVYNYLEDEGFDMEEDDGIDDILFDMNDPFMIYDPDVLYQMENGLDGFEPGSAEVFDKPITYSEYIN